MVDVSVFHPYNVADACSVSNVLSSRTLYSAARSAGCVFCCCYYVLYECLHKKPRAPNPSYEELRRRLERERADGQFREVHLDVDDLQDVDALRNRRRLSAGELASIVLAKKIGQAFLTDDQNARRLASAIMDDRKVQTTPHLVGWLYFTGNLVDGDKDAIAREHEALGRPLVRYFQEMYEEAMRCRLMQKQEGDSGPA